MNKRELKEIFDRNNVPENVIYELEDTNIGELLGIEQTTHGWQIYDSERGRKSVFGKFDSEDEACRALMAKVDRRLRREFGRSLMP